MFASRWMYRVRRSAVIMDDRVSRYSPSVNVYDSEYLFGERSGISLLSNECEDVLLPRC